MTRVENIFLVRSTQDFGPPKPNMVPAINRLLDLEGKQKTAMLLGRWDEVVERKPNGRMVEGLRRPNRFATAVWASDDSPPDTFRRDDEDHRGWVFRSGGVMSIGGKFFIGEHPGGKNRDLIMRIDTGDFSPLDLAEIEARIKSGVEYFPHGAFALEERAAQLLGEQESQVAEEPQEGDVDGREDQAEKHAKSKGPRAQLITRKPNYGKPIAINHDTGRILIPKFSRRVFRIPEGASIIHAGMFRGEEFVLVNDGGIPRLIDPRTLRGELSDLRGFFNGLEVTRLKTNEARRTRYHDKKMDRRATDGPTEEIPSSAQAEAAASTDETIRT